MKRLAPFLGFLLTLTVGHSADPKDPIPLVSFAQFPMPLARMYVSAAAGLSSTKAEMGVPYPNDYPPAVQVDFEDARPYTIDKPGTYSFPSVNTLRVYSIANVKRAPYKTIQPQITALQKILKERPKSVPNGPNVANSLSDYPHSDSAHAFELHIRYVDAAWGSGIGYMTVFTQDGSNHASNDELDYVFQGLSKDGAFYVSGDFRLSHRKLNHWSVDVVKGDYSPDIRLLTPLKDDSFVPSLTKLSQWLGTLKISVPQE